MDENNYKLYCSKCKTYYDMDTYVEKYKNKKFKCSGCIDIYIYTRNKENLMRGLKYCVDCKTTQDISEFYDDQLKFYMDHCKSCKHKCRKSMLHLFE